MTTLQDLHSKLQGENVDKMYRVLADLQTGRASLVEAEHEINELTTSTINETLAWVREVWLGIQFLDKYSEDEEYWNDIKGNNHCVEMHISDFEKMRDLLALLETKDTN